MLCRFCALEVPMGQESRSSAYPYGSIHKKCWSSYVQTRYRVRGDRLLAGGASEPHLQSVETEASHPAVEELKSEGTNIESKEPVTLLKSGPMPPNQQEVSDPSTTAPPAMAICPKCQTSTTKPQQNYCRQCGCRLAPRLEEEQP